MIPLHIVTYDIENKKTLKIQYEGITYKVVGNCNRCGKCCKEVNCNKLIYETLNGKIAYRCKDQWIKPWHCKLFPYDPEEKLREDCGYKLVKVG